MKTEEQKVLSGSYRTPDGKAQIDWELRRTENGLEFSATGEYEWSSGQCIDTIAEEYPQDRIVQSLARIWARWHLNGTCPGTPEQEQAVREWRELNANEKGVNTYEAACGMLKLVGLYEVPLLGTVKATGGFPPEVLSGERGYRYGERWLFEPIPQDVLDELEALASIKHKAPQESLHEHKAKQFLKDNGLRLRATLSDTKAAAWEPSGHHYRVTLSRGRADASRRLVFDFWGSRADADAGKTELTPYDVLACISGEISTPDTFEEFCGEDGYERDSIKALQTFRRADRFAKRLRAFFTDQEQEQLQEIR